MRNLIWALLSAALLAAAPSAQARPPVWVVRDADSELVLFGSIHVLPPGVDWEPPALAQALARADDLWFEIPMDPATESRAAQLAVAHGVLPAGQSLLAKLSPTGRERLLKACETYHIAPGLLDRLEPWYAEVALSGAQFRAYGAAAETGVEQIVAAQAPASARREAFETIDQQIAMFDGATEAAQIASLEETLAEMDTDPASYDRMLKSWMASDVAGLEKDALAPLRMVSPEIYARLVLDRNAAWTRVLDGRLRGKGRTVAVVGVGHLIGPGGVPARLRALGYSVEGP